MLKITLYTIVVRETNFNAGGIRIHIHHYNNIEKFVDRIDKYYNDWHCYDYDHEIPITGYDNIRSDILNNELNHENIYYFDSDLTISTYRSEVDINDFNIEFLDLRW